MLVVSNNSNLTPSRAIAIFCLSSPENLAYANPRIFDHSDLIRMTDLFSDFITKSERRPRGLKDTQIVLKTIMF